MMRVDGAEVQRSLGRIEGKVDSLISTFAAHIVDDKTNFSNIDKRLVSTEKKINRWAGGLAVLSSIGIALIGYFKH